ncbi:hypothetical protein N7513_012988 [Penicillium frequentans]|nr:hypothetical protein N7513_012988 [Penicillium glabrum]
MPMASLKAGRALELKVSDEPDELFNGIGLVAGDTSRITLEGPARANPHTRLCEFEKQGEERCDGSDSSARFEGDNTRVSQFEPRNLGILTGTIQGPSGIWGILGSPGAQEERHDNLGTKRRAPWRGARSGLGV